MRRVAQMMSLGDTARWLGITDAELAAVIERGRLRVIPPSSEQRIHAADLDAYLAASSHQPRHRFFRWLRRSA